VTEKETAGKSDAKSLLLRLFSGFQEESLDDRKVVTERVERIYLQDRMCIILSSLVS
jgi:hypothetical protein